MKHKVSVIGSGFVGTMTAQKVVEKGLADVVLVDIVNGLPQGKALDISQASSLEGFDCAIEGTNDFSDIRDSDIIVVTAGLPRTPGMTREDLAAKNGGIIRSVVEEIKTQAPAAIIIIVTNPLDVMAHLAWEVSGFPAARVMGMGGILDTARYIYFLSQETGISARDIQAMVLGSHGDTMIPVESFTRVRGIPIRYFVGEERLQAITERTKNGGAEIVSLLKTGSAWHAPAASVTAMIEAILQDRKTLVPVSACLNGEYGIEGIHIGVPVILGSSGIERICEVSLTDLELSELKHSAEVARTSFQGLKRL